MRLHIKDNGEHYNDFKIGPYVGVNFSPSTGILALFEKESGEVIIEWERVRSVEMQLNTTGWDMIINRNGENQ